MCAASSAFAADDPYAFTSEDDYELQHPPAKNYYRPLPPATGTTTPVSAAPEEVAATREPDAAPKASMFGKKEAASQPATAEAARPEDKMLKGELSMLGMTEFLNPQNFAGVGVGYFSLNSVSYLQIEPMLDLHFLQNRLHLDLGAPINVTLFDPNGGGFKAAGAIRKQDWDEWQDYFKILRRLQYGKKEDHFYLRLSQVGAASLGHGGFMRRYNNNMFANSTHLGLELDAYNDYVGGEAFLSDVTFQSRVLGGLAFVKPLGGMQSAIARSFSIGGYYTGDLAAPTTLRRDSQGVVLTDRADNPLYYSQALHGVGADVEVKPVRIGDLIDIKTYLDFNQFINYGNGFTAGVLGRFNIPIPFFAIRARAEYRNLGDQYLPSYFDNFYEIQKLQMVTASASTFTPTKLAFMESIHTGQRRSNGYFEVTVSWVDKLALTAAYDYGGGFLQQDFLLHAELTAFDWLRFFATYHKRNFDNWSQLFSFQENDLLYGQVRLEILPILFLNGRVMKTFVWDPSVDLGLGGLRNVWSYQADIELGWQW
jgi:hypothetical protein